VFTAPFLVNVRKISFNGSLAMVLYNEVNDYVDTYIDCAWFRKAVHRYLKIEN